MAHIRLVDANGGPVRWPRALARFLIAWRWFLPALAMLSWNGPKGAAPAFGTIAAGVLAYAALSRLHPQRQFAHDALCGTRLIDWRPPRPRS